MKVADIYNYNNGKKKVKFFEMGVYEHIKELGYRYTKIKNKTFFLKEENGIYNEVSFKDVKDAFHDYIKDNFDKLEINGEIERHDFMEEYYRQKVVKNSSNIRDDLFEDFESCEDKRHFLLLEVDNKYKIKHKKEIMLNFLINEEFVESKDVIGNFVEGCPLFYKKINHENYLIYTVSNYKYKWESPRYNFIKINAKSEKEFIVRENNSYSIIKEDFDLENDIDTYKLEIKR